MYLVDNNLEWFGTIVLGVGSQQRPNMGTQSVPHFYAAEPLLLHIRQVCQKKLLVRVCQVVENCLSEYQVVENHLSECQVVENPLLHYLGT